MKRRPPDDPLASVCEGDQIRRDERPPSTSSRPDDAEMRPHYDFIGGVRGKYAAQFPAGCIAVVLDPDVAEVFPDAAAVNEALRNLTAAKRQPGGSG